MIEGRVYLVDLVASTRKTRGVRQLYDFYPYQIDDFVWYSLIYNFCSLHYYLYSISFMYICAFTFVAPSVAAAAC